MGGGSDRPPVLREEPVREVVQHRISNQLHGQKQVVLA
jgi:hypothetical protein